MIPGASGVLEEGHFALRLDEAHDEVFVRQALQQENWELLQTLVPETTYRYFTSPEAAPVLERIRRAGNVVHY